MRRRAFAGLRLSHSIHFTEDEIVVSLPEEMTKTGLPWKAPVGALAGSAPPNIGQVYRKKVTQLSAALDNPIFERPHSRRFVA